MSVTVYSKPHCVQCIATKRYMSNRGIEFTSVDVTEDQGAFDLITGLGYQQVPVVIAGEEHWSGFQPEKLSGLI